MRIFALAIVLLTTASAQAQVGGANVWGGTPRSLNFTPVDTSRAIGASNLNTAFRPPSAATNKPFNLGSLMPNITMPSWPPKNAQVSVLPQKQNPFQPNPIKGGVNMFPSPTKKK